MRSASLPVVVPKAVLEDPDIEGVVLGLGLMDEVQEELLVNPLRPRL